MFRRASIIMVAVTALMGGTAMALSSYLGRDLVDPDGFLGPGWVRLPLLVLAALVADMLPQYFWKAKGRPAAGWAAMKDRWNVHWTRERWTLVVLGIACFYITYVSYRNIKSYLPFVMGDTKYDRELHVLDRAMFFGNEPASVLHSILGTGFSAHFLSFIYVAYLPLVAILVAIYAVWSRNLRFGYWFVLGQVLLWSLGTIAYYCLPTLGPGYRYPWLYTDLPTTGAGDLVDSLFYGRMKVTLGESERAVQSIAAFASLHTAATLHWALMVQYTVRSRPLKIILWVNFGLTILATLYFGWHYVADDIAGAAIALVSFLVAGWAAGVVFTKKGMRLGPGPDETGGAAPDDPSAPAPVGAAARAD